MEKIKIKGKVYDVVSIIHFSANVLKIVFPEESDIPAFWGDIEVCTAGGLPYAIKNGYETIYKKEDRTVYLSNDGSVYVPPAPPEPVPEPAPPTLEEVKAAKKAEISAVCEAVIYSGCDVRLSDGGIYHFSLTGKDQLNLFGKQSQLAAGADVLEYHADGQPCRYYSVEDMENIVGSAMWYVSYHTTYCNALNMWIAGCESVEEVQGIFYGADVPEEYRSEVLNTYLKQIEENLGKEAEDEEPV